MTIVQYSESKSDLCLRENIHHCSCASLGWLYNEIGLLSIMPPLLGLFIEFSTHLNSQFQSKQELPIRGLNILPNFDGLRE